MTATVAFMQLVPGSFKPYDCNCGGDTGGNHSLTCPKSVFTPDPNLPKIDPYVWPPVPKFLRPQPQGEQCGRCWQNHTPPFVCNCNCHIKPVWGTTTTQFDTGDDLDAPQTT